MAFVAQPLLPGDLFETAQKFAADADRRLAALPSPAERQPYFAALWDQARELGWHQVAVGEDAGGMGGSLSDVAAVVEGGGRHALPLPLASLCLTPATLLGAVPDQPAILTGIASGEAIVVPVLGCAQLTAERNGCGFAVRGAVRGAEFLPGADRLLVTATLDGAPALFAMPSNHPGLSIAHFQRMDGRPSADLVFDAVSIPAEVALAHGRAVAAAVERAKAEATLLVCIETVAAMGALTEQTIAYLDGREQFGVKLSTFQVLRHKVVDMYVAWESTRALVGHVLQCAAAGPLPARDLALAKLRLGHAGPFVAETAIQLHGGMGMTDELAATRLARRILMSRHEYGDAIHHAGVLRLLDRETHP